LSSGLARRYRIVKKLGAGGMGSVFLAEQIALGNRPVALKVLSRRLLDDPQFLQRFHHEGASTARIRHVNVVTIYESGQADDATPYIAMEYLEGESLRDALTRRGALPVAECAEILQQIARGLNAAHKLGIIHRDLKPDNIFLTRGDEGELIVKVVDFGIAKMREAATHTLTGLVLGTPAYMSCEQASGMRGDDLDGRSDLYSLGVVAYEMLTGRVPFHSDTPLGYIRKHMLEEPPSFRAAAPALSLPPPTEAVVMKALAKDRTQRYASVLEFAREFAQARAAPTHSEFSQYGAPLSPSVPVPSPATARDPAAFGRGQGAGPVGGPRSAPQPSAPASATRRQADVAVQTPPPVSPASLSPTPGVGQVREPPPEERVALTVPEERSPVFLITLATIVVGVIAGVLLWMYWPSPPKPASPTTPVPAVSRPQTNPHLPMQPPAVNPPQFVREKPNLSNERAEIAKKVKAAITAGDADFEEGQYDGAIAAYRSGLAVDPSNAQLRQRIERATAAKEAESAVPH